MKLKKQTKTETMLTLLTATTSQTSVMTFAILDAFACFTTCCHRTLFIRLFLHAVANYSFTLTYMRIVKYFTVDGLWIISKFCVTPTDSLKILIHVFWWIYAHIKIRYISRSKITGWYVQINRYAKLSKMNISIYSSRSKVCKYQLLHIPTNTC